jgi:hypothetical protein
VGQSPRYEPLRSSYETIKPIILDHNVLARPRDLPSSLDLVTSGTPTNQNINTPTIEKEKWSRKKSHAIHASPLSCRSVCMSLSSPSTASPLSDGDISPRVSTLGSSLPFSLLLRRPTVAGGLLSCIGEPSARGGVLLSRIGVLARTSCVASVTAIALDGRVAGRSGVFSREESLVPAETICGVLV